MRICGCEISAKEVRLAVVYLNDESKLEMLRLTTTRIELEDDTSEADLQTFSREHEIDTFVIKTRAKKGRMAGGAVGAAPIGVVCGRAQYPTLARYP